MLHLEGPEEEGGIVSIAAATPAMQSIRCVVGGDGAQSYTTDAFPKEYSSAVFDDYSALSAWWAQTCGMQGQGEYDPLVYSPTLRPMSLSSVPPLQRMCGISGIRRCYHYPEVPSLLVDIREDPRAQPDTCGFSRSRADPCCVLGGGLNLAAGQHSAWDIPCL